MRKIALAALALTVVSCGAVKTESTCATTDIPPVAAEAIMCSNGIARFRWYTAPAHDVSEPSERPVVGQVLDGDWWDPEDMYETAGGIAVPKTPKSSSPKAPKSSSPKPAPKS